MIASGPIGRSRTSSGPTSGAWIPVTLTAEGDQFIGRMRAIQPLPLVDAANMWLQLGSVQDDRCRDASIRHPSFTRVDLPTACTYSVFVPYNYDYGGLTRVGILEAKFQDESWNWHSYKAKFNLIYVPRPDKIAIKRLLPQDPVHLTSGVKQTFRYEIVNTTSLTIFPKQHRLGVGGWQDIPWCAVLGPGARCEVNFDITDNTAEVRNVMAEYQVRYEIDNNVSYWSDILNVEYILSPPSQSFLNLDLTLCSRSNRLMRYDRSFQMKFKFSDNGELTQTKQFFVDPACRKPFSKAQNSAFMKSDLSLFKWLEDLTEPSKISAKYQLTNRREYPGTKDILYDLDITWQAPGTNTDSSRFNFQDYLLLRENGEVRISTSYCYGAQPKACLIGLSEVNTVRAAPGILYFEPWFLVLGYSKPETTSNKSMKRGRYATEYEYAIAIFSSSACFFDEYHRSACLWAKST